eukprot:a342544_21.p1 GENE.a342544_21~~a342544_21.p1  ORF type:complete len:387 (-),score=140.66 a342544_21:55-1185(-)
MRAGSLFFAAIAVTLAVSVFAESSLEAILRAEYPHRSDEEITKLAALMREHAPAQLADEHVPLLDLSACPPLPSRPPPSNVQDLSPVDIKIIAGVGDSISMGSNALSTNWLNLKRYPGLAWSAGGDAGVTSIANILKTFSPSIYGASTGSGDNAPLGANYAVAGSIVQDLTTQIQSMIQGLKSNPALNYTGDWKMVNVFTGGNNLCDVCVDSAPNNAAAYEAGLESAFELLATMPRTFVNLISAMDYTQLVQFKGPFCAAALDIVCKCCTSDDAALRQITADTIVQYNQVIAAMAAKWNGIREDFAVVNQPALINTLLPDKSYLSTADCFHPSGTGQALLAKGIWNNLLQPLSAKSTSVSPSDAIICPTVESVFFS